MFPSSLPWHLHILTAVNCCRFQLRVCVYVWVVFTWHGIYCMDMVYRYVPLPGIGSVHCLNSIPCHGILGLHCTFHRINPFILQQFVPFKIQITVLCRWMPIWKYLRINISQKRCSFMLMTSTHDASFVFGDGITTRTSNTADKILV